MQAIKYISIPEPCSQNWNEMTAVDKGRHCAHCCKTVTDFTAMSNQQIIDQIANSANICGRVEVWQLNSINAGLIKPQPCMGYKGWLLAIFLFFALPPSKLLAQHKPHKGYVIKDKHKMAATDRLIAYYPAFQPEPPVPDSGKLSAKNICVPEAQITSLVGGITVKAVVKEPSPFFKDGFYQSIYDLLQNIIKL